MKKIIIILAVAALLGSMFSSCKSHEKCPAYSQVQHEQNEASV